MRQMILAKGGIQYVSLLASFIMVTRKKRTCSNNTTLMKKAPWVTTSTVWPGVRRGRFPECTQVPGGPAAVVLQVIPVSPSANVDSGAGPAARGAAQGEAAAILAQGPALLVHSGGIHLLQVRRGRPQAALQPDAPSPPEEGIDDC